MANLLLKDLNPIVNPSQQAEAWIFDENTSFPRDRKITLGSLFTWLKQQLTGELLNASITGNANTVTAGVYTAGNQTIGGNKTFSELTVFNNNVNITGNLTVSGTEVVVDTETIKLQDNIIEINSGQTGTPFSTLKSGLEINRGDLDNYFLVFSESDQHFKIGVELDLQSVATRQDTPVDNGIAYWNETELRFDTTADFTWGVDGLSIFGETVTTTSGPAMNNKIYTQEVVIPDGKGAVMVGDVEFLEGVTVGVGSILIIL